MRSISNVNGSTELFDLYKDDGSFSYQPCLVFVGAQFESCWDNSEFVLKFFRRLKKRKKKEKEELREFCAKNKLDYISTKKDLIRIYKTAKYLNFFKNGDKNS